jgi:hypothetical protein
MPPTSERSDKLFMDWSHKVLEELTNLNNRFTSLEAKQDAFAKLIEERLNNMETKLNSTNNLLTGNGKPEKGLLIRVDRLEQEHVKGLDVRIDRLEQSENRRTWLTRAAIVTSLAALASTIMTFFHR